MSIDRVVMFSRGGRGITLLEEDADSYQPVHHELYATLPENGDLPRVTRWFDAAGRPALGHLANHFPAHDDWIRGNLNWGAPTVQQVLDTAMAFAVMNNHFEIADFLLAHGADINTNWSSHEPASILHELVWHKNYEAMQFLIDRGIDMTIEDYRWHGTARGWAFHAAGDEKMAQWLEEAERQRERPAR